MKYIYTLLSVTLWLNVNAQVKVEQGSNSPEFKLDKQPQFTSVQSDKGNNYFLISHTERGSKVYTVVAADKAGNITTANEVWSNMGLINNNNFLNKLLIINDKPIAFVENRNKDAAKNVLSAKLVDSKGTVSATGVDIGTLEMTKMTNPGDWYVSMTPDKKHVVVIGRIPHEKDIVDKFKYFILDDNLKEVSKGEFSFAGVTKKIEVFNYLVSDKGDFYIISEDFDKTYKYPTVYKYSAGGQGVVIPVMLSNPDQKNLSYTSTVNPSGDLVIAGYMQKRKTFSAGDVQSIGTWLFNSSKINEVKTFEFQAPITNLTARNIIYNGNTFYLIGEQYLAEKQQNRVAGVRSLGMDEVFDYTHNDIMVTGFTTDGAFKFDLPVSRKFKVRDFDQDMMVASGIINGKLALIFNDLHGKYFSERSYTNYKLPVAVLITNDGLMEAPVNFAKELDVKVSSYTLYPQFFSASNGQIVVLSGNNNSVKTVTFK